jgi:hypothetical protein
VPAPLGFGTVAEAGGGYAVGFAALGLLALAPAAARPALTPAGCHGATGGYCRTLSISSWPNSASNCS